MNLIEGKTFDPFEDMDIDDLDEYNALTRAIESAALRLKQIQLKESRLTDNGHMQYYADAKFTEPVTFYIAGFDQARSTEIKKYYDKNGPVEIVQQIKNLAHRSAKINETLVELIKRRKKIYKDAATRYLERESSLYDKQELSKDQHPKAVWYYDEQWRRRWLINPALTYETPGYAGTAEHHVYDEKARTTYFELSKILKSNGIHRFKAVYTGRDSDGEETIVAVAPFNVLVWEFTSDKNTVFIAGEKPLNAERLNKPQIIRDCVLAVATALNKLEIDGKPKTPTTP